jgi:hypothetical protein
MPEIIGFQLVIHTVKGKTTLIDAVAVATDKGTEVSFIVQITTDGIKAQYNISIDTVFIGHHDGNNTGAVIGHADFHTVFVGQNVKIVLFTVNLNLEIGGLETGFRCGRLASCKQQGQDNAATAKRPAALKNVFLIEGLLW